MLLQGAAMVKSRRVVRFAELLMMVFGSDVSRSRSTSPWGRDALYEACWLGMISMRGKISRGREVILRLSSVWLWGWSEWSIIVRFVSGIVNAGA